MKAEQQDLGLTELIGELTRKARTKLNDWGLQFTVSDPRIVQDDEVPDWSYAIVEFNLKRRPRSFDAFRDRLVREVYDRIRPEDAAKVLVVVK